jgi:hypothetical protein
LINWWVFKCFVKFLFSPSFDKIRANNLILQYNIYSSLFHIIFYFLQVLYLKNWLTPIGDENIIALSFLNFGWLGFIIAIFIQIVFPYLFNLVTILLIWKYFDNKLKIKILEEEN